MEYNEKQIHIMDTAEKLFATKGFNGTSVRDIAEAAEVNLAMISYYFGSKEKLLEAVFVYRSEFFKLQLESMIQNKELTPLQKMESLIDEYINKLTSQQYFNTIMLREQMKNSNPLVIAQIYNLKNRNMLLIQELIEEGQKKGVFTNDINIYLLMSTMVGIANHVH
ncbi:MAG TPA: TetR family transcriptional regulator, partial [Chitinophagaceae bacterium]|nr:TetR family transcriptional regulator [Chitinophagaceae bacterium]